MCFHILHLPGDPAAVFSLFKTTPGVCFHIGEPRFLQSLTTPDVRFHILHLPGEPRCCFSLASDDSFSGASCERSHLQTLQMCVFTFFICQENPDAAFFFRSSGRLQMCVNTYKWTNGGLTTNTKTYCFTLNLNTVCFVFPIYTTQWWLCTQEHPVLQTTAVRCRVF